MNVLIISNSPMRLDNSIGNTYDNIFYGMRDVVFANIYSKEQFPNDRFVSKYFLISEKDIIKNMVSSKNRVGKEVIRDMTNLNSIKTTHKKTKRILKILRFKAFFWVKDIIWALGDWRNSNLNSFIQGFEPDIIFAPLVDNKALNILIQYVHKIARCKLITYAWDDVYSLNQFSLSPMFWLDRIYQRSAIKKVANESDIMYVISEAQKKEYEKCFKTKCKLLYKGYDFIERQNHYIGHPIKLVYTGNLGYKRWSSLLNIIDALKQINIDGVKAELYIYSKTALSKHIINSLNVDSVSCFLGGVSHEKAMEAQDNADIVVHVESFTKKARKSVRLSFSTKIVDYFYKGKCIYAVGPYDVASIDYLIKNDAAMVATNKDEIKDKLNMLINHQELIKEYGKKAWECGKKNHQIKDIQNKLKKDFEDLVNESNTD